jgi:hypothetical protein
LPGPRIWGLGPGRLDAGSRGHDAAGTEPALSVCRYVGDPRFASVAPVSKANQIASSVPYPVRRTGVVLAEARMPARQLVSSSASAHATTEASATSTLLHSPLVRRPRSYAVPVVLLLVVLCAGRPFVVLLGPPSATLVVEARPEALQGAERGRNSASPYGSPLSHEFGHSWARNRGCCRTCGVACGPKSIQEADGTA